MLEDAGFILWAAFLIAWVAIRYPAMRKARRTRTVRDARDPLDISLLAACGLGLAVLPVFWRITGWPDLADHALPSWCVLGGLIAGVAFLWLFHRSHSDLGRNWSVSLEIRDNHALVTNGVYAHVRHPMYASFLLWGIMQAFLIANWVAGLSGLVAIIALFAGRHRREERMMRAAFGAQYDAYCRRTARLIPRIY